MKIYLSILFILTFVGISCGQISDAKKLNSVKKIYLDNFGSEKSSPLIREKIKMNLLKSGRFQVVENAADADATLTGVIGVETVKIGRFFKDFPSGQMSETPATRYKGLGFLRLVDKDKNTFWMVDYKHTFSFRDSAAQSVADKAVRQLLEDCRQAAQNSGK